MPEPTGKPHFVRLYFTWLRLRLCVDVVLNSSALDMAFFSPEDIVDIGNTTLGKLESKEVDLPGRSKGLPVTFDVDQELGPKKHRRRKQDTDYEDKH